MQGIAFLLLLGLAEATQLKQLRVKAEEAQEDLTIKMPDAITAEVKLMEEQEESLNRHRLWQAPKNSPQLALVQGKAETNSHLSKMLESGVVHSELKPIVLAKVKMVMNFVQSSKDEFERGTVDEKKKIQQKAEAMIMQNAGTRSFNKELCQALWGETTEMASTLSYYYCPGLIYPPANMDGRPPLKTLQLEPPSRLRSAFLAEYFWNAMLTNNKQQVISLLEKDACYYWGGKKEGVCGEKEVSRTLPYLGFPEGSKLSKPTTWHCDATTCITPVKAWAEHENYCLTTWGASGKATEVIVPLDLWR